jgi:hypothetical protein
VPAMGGLIAWLPTRRRNADLARRSALPISPTLAISSKES